MNHPDYDYMIVMERRREELAAAEQSRRFKEARLALRINMGYQPSRARRLVDGLALSAARFLSAVGGWLLNLSCRLQTRAEMFNPNPAGAEPQPSPCA